MFQHGLYRLRRLSPLQVGPPDPHHGPRKTPAVRIAGFREPLPRQIRVVSLNWREFPGIGRGKAVGQHGHRGNGDSVEGGSDQRFGVDSVTERLSHPQIVEGRLEGVHHQVGGPEGHIGVQLVPEPGIVLYTVDFSLVRQGNVVDRSRLVGRKHRWGDRGVVELRDHLFQVGFVGSPVVGIRRQHDPVQLGPFHQPEGAAAQQRFRPRRPPGTVLLEQVSGRYPAEGQDQGQVGRGIVGRKGDGVIVQRRDAQGIEGQVGGNDLSPVPDRPVEPFEIEPRGGVRPPFEGVLEVVSRERMAVGEDQVGLQVKRPGEPVIGDLPPGRGGRQQVVVPVHAHQRFVDQGVIVADHLVVGGGHVQVAVLGLEAGEDLVLGRRRVGRKRNADGVDVRSGRLGRLLVRPCQRGRADHAYRGKDRNGESDPHVKFPSSRTGDTDHSRYRITLPASISTR